MATSKDYIEYCCEQIRGTGDVFYRKMFGEYMVYVNARPVLLVCDNTVYVKILPELSNILDEAEKGFPYDGAKEHYILDIDDRPLSVDVVTILRDITPLPIKKARKK